MERYDADPVEKVQDKLYRSSSVADSHKNGAGRFTDVANDYWS